MFRGTVEFLKKMPAPALVGWRALADPFAGTSEDRPPAGPVADFPARARKLRAERGPHIGATRGGKPSDVERGFAKTLRRTTQC